MSIREQMLRELDSKEIFDLARAYAFEYMDQIQKMEVFPSDANLKKMMVFDEIFPEESVAANEVIAQLHKFGSPATIAQTGGKYFGFVNGGAIPVSLGVKWLSDIWDQCGSLYLTSPINAQLETVCEKWLRNIFNLPEDTVAGFVSGTSMANLCGLAAARFQILNKLGWDINLNGLNGAPNLRIIAHEQLHASVKKTLSMLGFGQKSVEWIPSDGQGRLVLDKLPALDRSCLVILQAGNANTGSFDDFDQICDAANEADAWVHIDGAFGLWAAASESLSYLTRGIEKASSWAVDGHKSLNAPYDSGIILCKYPSSLIKALQATGEYLLFSDKRDPLLYTPELSKRSRAIELWATMKYLGRRGIDEMITSFHVRAKQLEQGLKNIGYQIINDVVFNQVLVACDNDQKTKKIIDYIQKSGRCWVGGSVWEGKNVMRISVCSWMTGEKDIEDTIELFEDAWSKLVP